MTRLFAGAATAILGLLSSVSAAYAESGSPPPVENAPKLDSEKADERLSAAKLTPIVASPHDASKTAFQLYWEIDIPVLATSAILASARLLRAVAPTCAKVDGHCNPAELNALDRHFA